MIKNVNKGNKKIWPHLQSLKLLTLIILSITNNTYSLFQFSKYWLYKIFHMLPFLTHLKCGFLQGLTFKPAFLTCFCNMLLWFLSMCITSQRPPFVYAIPLPRCLPLSPTYQQASFSPFKTLLKDEPPQPLQVKVHGTLFFVPHTII